MSVKETAVIAAVTMCITSLYSWLTGKPISNAIYFSILFAIVLFIRDKRRKKKSLEEMKRQLK